MADQHWFTVHALDDVTGAEVIIRSITDCNNVSCEFIINGSTATIYIYSGYTISFTVNAAGYVSKRWTGSSSLNDVYVYLEPNKYYDCVNDVCTQVGTVTQYVNDPTCNNACAVPPKYYDCVNGVCTEVGYVTSHIDDPTCNNECVAPPTSTSSMLIMVVALAGAYLLYSSMNGKKMRGKEE